MPILYQDSTGCCEVDHNSDGIHILQPSLTIHYCKPSVLELSQTWTYLFEVLQFLYHFKIRSGTVLFYYMLAICITQQGLRFYNFGSLPDSRLRDFHFHRWVHCIVTTKIWYYSLCCFYWFLIILFDSLYSSTLH